MSVELIAVAGGLLIIAGALAEKARKLKPKAVPVKVNKQPLQAIWYYFKFLLTTS